MKRFFFAVLLFAGLIAQAQESTFKAKLEEDIASYDDQIKTNCGPGIKSVWMGGTLGSNPREAAGTDNAVTTLVTSALDGIQSACLNNAAVKAKVSKIKSIEFKRGKGAMLAKLSGTKLEIAVDPKFTANNPADQEEKMKETLIKSLDK